MKDEILKQKDETIDNTMSELVKIAARDGKNVVNALEKAFENDMIGKIVDNILNAEEVEAKEKERRAKEQKRFFSRQEFRMSDEELDSRIRGIVFENIALELLAEKGEPPNRKLSDLLTDICKRPHIFLSYVRNQMEFELSNETAPFKRDRIFNQIKEIDSAKNDLPLHPFNNDVIAIKTDESGKIIVTGSYEMKNYHITEKEEVEDIDNQLANSKLDTVNILSSVLKYLPVYARCYERNMGRKFNIPTDIDVVEESEFKQCIVQPDMYFPSKEKRQAYFDSLSEICDDLITVGIKTETFVKISNNLKLLVKDRLEKERKKRFNLSKTVNR